MGLFGPSSQAVAIYNTMATMLLDFQKNSDKLDIASDYPAFNEEIMDNFVGYFSYYVVGILSSIVEDNIQDAYSDARLTSDFLMAKGLGLYDIVDDHATNLCVRNLWMTTDNNKKLVSNLLLDFDSFLRRIK